MQDAMIQMAFFGVNMKIYWTKQKRDSEFLAAKALKLYCGDSDMLCHDDKGRPYFQNSKINISISHSDNMWLCVLCKDKASIDIEHVADREYLRIADRFFSPAEQQFVRSAGADGFFRLWVRKEAYVKYLGQGISYGLENFSLSNGIALKDEYEDVLFREIDFGNDFRCAICIAKEDFFWKQIRTEEMHI